MDIFRRAAILIVALLIAGPARGVMLSSSQVVHLTARSAQNAAGQSGGLTIVVIAGEDAVNVIQQKTAVAPVVEVRDRNDQPVAGALVRFAIQGGRATFSGGRTLTVTTNIAGRAAVSGLTPTSSGAFQITASAAFQGQTAVATIAQTNVLTAAAAEAAGAAGAGTTGTGAAGAGGATGAGSGTTAAAAGGAAAGGLGAAAMTAIAGGAGAGAIFVAEKTGAFGEPGDDACTFSISPASFTVPSTFNSVTVTATPSAPSCDPGRLSVTPSNSFIQFATPGAPSGAGVFTITLNINGNTPGDPPRTGTITLGGHVVTVSQAASCAFSVSPSSLTFPASGGSLGVVLAAVPSGCDTAWTASTISPFISINPTSGTAAGVITLTAAPNPFRGPNGNLTGNVSIGPIIVPFVELGNP